MTVKVFEYRWFVVSLILLGLGFAAVSLVAMHREMARMDMKNLTGGPVWYVTSVEFDALRLESALHQYSHDKNAVDDVHQAFDILWSRLAQMKVGNTHDTLVQYGTDMTVYERLMATLVASDDRIAALDFGTDDLLDLSEAFSQFSSDLRASSLEVLERSVLESNVLHLSALSIAKKVLYVSLTVASAAALLLIVAALDSVQTRRLLTEKEALLEEAYAADIAKSQFISVINHELRTPLTSISASLALLTSGTVSQTPEKISRLIGIAERNCVTLRKLVDDLLDTERFASGKMNFDFQVIDLSQTLKRTIEDSQSYADSYNVELSADDITPDIKANADPARINQLMANLISNAIKFSDEGGKVQVGLTADTGRAVVTVKDYGRGIPQKDRLRIFERFQQVDSSDKRERGGTGLGLSIVKAISEAHRAEMKVESELGQGSTFYISFPNMNPTIATVPSNFS